MLHDMALVEWRVAREKTQAQMAKALHVGQPAVPKLENRADMHVRNRCRSIEGAGRYAGDYGAVSARVVVVKGFGEMGE